MAKVALVTGSGKRRLGWHVVQALAERRYGLVIHYNTSRGCGRDDGRVAYTRD